VIYDAQRRLMLPAGLSIGSGVRGGAPPEPVPLYSFSFADTFAAGFPSVAAQSAQGWSSQRPSFSSAYVQLSASSWDGPTVSGSGDSDGRIQQFASDRRGFLLEPEMELGGTVNYLNYSTDLTTVINAQLYWLYTQGPPAASYSSAGSSPRVGFTNGTRVVAAVGDNANYSYGFNLLGISTRYYVYSQWARAASGTQTHYRRFGNNIVSSTVNTTWEFQQISDLYNNGDTKYVVPVGNLGTSPVAADIYVTQAQLHRGRIALSPILTTGGAASKRGDILYTTAGTAAVMMGAGGRLSVYLSFVPLGPLSHMGDEGAVPYLWLWGAAVSTWLDFVPATRIATLHVPAGSYAFPTPLPDCARGDYYEVNLSTNSNGNSTLKARVNGGSVTNCGTSGVLAAANLVNPVFAPCNAGASQQQIPCMVDRIRTYAPGDIPVWAQ